MENEVLISAVSPQKKKKNRFNIYVDGEYTASLGAEACTVFGIKTGATLGAETLAEAILQDNTRYAFDSALAMLAHRMRTRHEIEKRLTERGITDDAIAAAIDKLLGYGYVDDAAYAKEYIESAVSAAKYGRKVLTHKLREKGIDDALIDNTLLAYTDEMEKDIAAQHLNKLRVRYAGDKTARKKMFNMLYRRGFGYDIITTLLSGDDDF